MAPLHPSFLFIFLAFITLSQAHAISGPACARHNYGSENCVSKCRANWGFGNYVMGQHPWGPVMSMLPTNLSMDGVLSEACGFPPSSGESSVSSTSLVVESTPVVVPYLSPISSSLSTLFSLSSITTSVVKSSSIPGSSSSIVTSPAHSLLSSSSPVPKSTWSTIISSDLPSSSNLSSPNTSLLTAEPSTKSSPSPPPSSSLSTSSSPSALPSPSVFTGSDNSTDNKITTSSSSQTSSSDIYAYLTAHNTVRAQYGAVNLTWADDLAATAQTWASRCVFEHSNGPNGENLAAGTGGYNIADGVGDWVSEASQYNASNPVPSHFTQVVWKATTQLGCALVSCGAGAIFDASYGPANYIVCEYSPPGNVIGEFAQNVQT